MDSGGGELKLIEDDDVDLYADGWDEALAQVSALVLRRYHATPSLAVHGELEELLEDITDLGRA